MFTLLLSDTNELLEFNSQENLQNWFEQNQCRLTRASQLAQLCLTDLSFSEFLNDCGARCEAGRLELNRA